jgi:ZIP family zinc transporter
MADNMTPVWAYTLLPVAAAMLGAIVVMWRRPGPVLVSAIQHFTAGVVFAAAAGEILPDVMHRGSPAATLVGGALGVGAMLLVKQMEVWAKGPVGLMTAVGIDVLIDGLVLGLGFAAGQKQGLLLTVALTLELLFLSLTVTAELSERFKSPLVLLAITAGLALLLPAGALFAGPAATFPPQVLTGLFSFALMALLYLVTEELLSEAHEVPDKPWVTASFFAGFLLLLMLEELVA